VTQAQALVILLIVVSIYCTIGVELYREEAPQALALALAMPIPKAMATASAAKLSLLLLPSSTGHFRSLE
jgi:hypothetical protein